MRQPERRIARSMGRLSIRESKPAEYYVREARAVAQKYDRGDPNYGHFCVEVVRQSREAMDEQMLRGLISELQRFVATAGEPKASKPIPCLRNRVRYNKKDFRDAYDVG